MSFVLRVFHTPSRKLALGGVVFSVIASLLVYAILVVRPVPLLQYYDRPLLDLLAILQTFDSGIQRRLILAFTLLAVFYALGWWSTNRLAQTTSNDAASGHRAPGQHRVAWMVTLLGAAVAAGLLLLLYPFDAADIFDNIAHGRIFGVYADNPFIALPSQFPKDPFLPYVAWADSPSAYGPAWEMLAGLAARLAGNGIVANVLAFKLLPGIFAVLSVLLVYLLLKRRAPERSLSAVWLIAWNPLVLYETFGHGHNDMVMAACLLAACLAVDRRRYTLAVLALLAGALVKYIPLLLIPIAVVIALRELPSPFARLRYLVVTALAGLAMIVLVFAPFWEGAQILTVERRTEMFTTSLPSIIDYALRQSMDAARAAKLISWSAAGLTAFFALWQAQRADEDRSWLSFPRASINVLLFYLLITNLWFQQWYMVWLVGLAVLLPPEPRWGLSLLLSYTAFAKPLVFGPLVFYWDPPLTDLEIELRLTLGVMSLPWLASIAAFWKEKLVPLALPKVMSK